MIKLPSFYDSTGFSIPFHDSTTIGQGTEADRRARLLKQPASEILRDGQLRRPHTDLPDTPKLG